MRFERVRLSSAAHKWQTAFDIQCKCVHTCAPVHCPTRSLSVCVCVPSAGVLASRDSSVKVGGRDAHSGRHTLALFCFVLCITYNVLESNTGKHPSVPFFYFFFYNRLNFPRWLIPHSFLIFCPVQSSSVDPFFSSPPFLPLPASLLLPLHAGLCVYFL